ncbi:MAG: ABC transporter ATP-binding protein [Chloroflexi bacterium]|nr:ABC transporter ATP-binding protein [Chloroflexota bacterium]
MDVPVLRLEQLTKQFYEGVLQREIFSDINLDILSGQFSILTGPSGSGKSTLLNLISGIEPPTSGKIIVDGIELTALSEKRRTLFRRHQVGMVFQSFNLIPTLSVSENLMLPLDLTGVSRKEAKLRVIETLDRVGLADRSNSFPEQLSGGEQQRVAITRALVHDPTLVLADEPTGNLDSDNAHQIMGIFKNLVKDEGKTLIVVTHRSDMEPLADRVFHLEDGNITETFVNMGVNVEGT